MFGGIGSVCSAAVRLSNVDGGAVALLSATSSARELVYATDALAQQIDELQFVLGEGPCLDAYHSREQQLWPDMTVRAARERWPVFSSDVVSLQARAMFAYPVLTGETAVGVLELYRTAPGDLSEVEQQAGRACAAAIGSLLASEVEQMAELVDSPDSTVAESGRLQRRGHGGGAAGGVGRGSAAPLACVQLCRRPPDRRRRHRHRAAPALVASPARRRRRAGMMETMQTQLAIADLTAALADDFDVAAVLHAVAEHAQSCFDAASAVVILLDRRHPDHTDVQVVAESVRDELGADPVLHLSGPGPASAVDGVVAMIADLDDERPGRTRWPDYRARARGRSVRCGRSR
ncbi:GAF domain-containing protein [Nocardia thailandica]